MSEHLFPYRWNLADGFPAKGIEPNGCKVFGMFICGGGSTMGYKLAGFEHLGGVEIDAKVAAAYKANHKPKHLFVEDIRKFNHREDLPPELFDLDILDGSPPCSTFSMAGARERGWGKEKVFREGQAMQTLDDLVFEYVKTIAKLKPKVCLLENVKGIIAGNAKWYSKQIVAQMEAAGYRVQVFLLNAASMGVPQKRERVFFIGLRRDFDLLRLVLRFDEKPILFGEIEDTDAQISRHEIKSAYSKKLLQNTDKHGILHTKKKSLGGKFGGTGFGFCAMKQATPLTIKACSKIYHYDKMNMCYDSEICSMGTYPQDYGFQGIKPMYLIGMSVPPVMAAQIANQIWVQWLSKIREK